MTDDQATELAYYIYNLVGPAHLDKMVANGAADSVMIHINKSIADRVSDLSPKAKSAYGFTVRGIIGKQSIYHIHDADYKWVSLSVDFCRTAMLWVPINRSGSTLTFKEFVDLMYHD